MIDYNLLIGIVGMLCILVAFVLDEFNKRFNQETYFYNVLNIIGAGFLLYYGLTLKGWPFVILNAIWVIAALVKLVKLVKIAGKR
ncbi:MAG TPA: hypothetical protein VJI15_05550 [Candidatus Nanoarchaeia archaeon]|nr:hypothetical protein [Candidatus Nanoarchaeia archaeon]